MNILLNMLSEDRMSSEPTSTKLKIEDNIGESIHIHVRNIRLEMTIKDFSKFSEEIKSAKKEVNDGDS